MASEHPTRLTEPPLLASVQPHFVSSYTSRREHPGLSPEQRETLGRILQSHEEPCASTVYTRRGFLLGDSTGSGKGRIIASVIAEQAIVRRGHPALWVSANQDLAHDATRDLGDICASSETAPTIHVNRVDAFAATLRERASAVLFCSYHYLRVHVDQIVRTIGPARDPVVVFDESHISKNAAGSGSKIASSVLRLQDGVPHARVLYSSATAMNNVRGMLHMTRLHLWGTTSVTDRGVPFTTARRFVQTVAGMGRTAPELLAVEMKRRGVYSSRTLDLSHIQLRTITCDTSHRRELFHRCIAIWNSIRRAHDGETSRGTPFWMSHQRFFRTLLTEMKVKEAIRLTEESLRAGKSVVIALQLTGESSQRRGQGDAGLLRQIYSACPDGWTPPDADGMRMPTNPIDQLISHFGTDRVAEISGRKVRRVSLADNIVQRRTLTNAEECAAFVRGQKHVAIITRSGTSGISLHDTNAEHPRPRVQLFLELPWDAPTFVQQCGRVNRTRQLSTPDILCLVTDIPAEVRYMHTLFRNVEDMSSITRGDRGCIPNIDIPGGVHLTSAIPWFVHWLSMRRVAHLAAAAAEHVVQTPHMYRHTRTRDAKRELDFPLTVETPSADVLQRHLIKALSNRGISLVHDMHPPALAYDDACRLHADVPSFFILPVHETHVGYVTRVIPSLRMVIDHNSARAVAPEVIADAVSCRFHREDLYRHLWDPMAYVCFLVHCYQSLGGRLPPVRWSTESHSRFPAPFRRACRWLVWYRARVSTAPSVSDRSLHTIMSMASAWYSTLPVNASVRDLTEMDVDIGSTTTDICGFMNRAMSLNVGRQQALFDGVGSVYEGYLRGDAEWALGPRDDATGHTDAVHVHEVRAVRSERLHPSLDVWLHDLRLSVRMRPSFAWSTVESKARLSEGGVGVVYRQTKTHTLMLHCGQALWSSRSDRVAYCRKPAKDMRIYLANNFVRVGATDDPTVRREWIRTVDAQAQEGFTRVSRMNILTGDTMRFWEPLQQWLRYVNSCRVSKMAVRVVKIHSQRGTDAHPNRPSSRVWVGIKIPGGFKERVRTIVRHAAESASRKRRREE